MRGTGPKVGMREGELEKSPVRKPRMIAPVSGIIFAGMILFGVIAESGGRSGRLWGGALAVVGLAWLWAEVRGRKARFWRMCFVLLAIAGPWLFISP